MHTGHHPEGEETQPYQPITTDNTHDELCTWFGIPTCVAIPVSSLDWHLHGGHDYYVSLRIEGLSGLSTIVTSEVYTHYSGPPTLGMVYEVSLNYPEVLTLL